MADNRKGFDERTGYLLDTYANAAAVRDNPKLTNPGMSLVWNRLEWDQDPTIAITIREDLMARAAVGKYSAEVTKYKEGGEKGEAPKANIDPVLLAGMKRLEASRDFYDNNFSTGISELTIGGNAGLMAYVSGRNGESPVDIPSELEKTLRSDKTPVGNAEGLTAEAVNEIVRSKVEGEAHNYVVRYDVQRRLVGINEAMKPSGETDSE
jgi:hypothetical protein